jgi:methylmalonyl-CoA/ethylmalonyl-CoA epimerase
MITRIHHVAAVVGDLEAAFAFWRDTLGLPVLAEADLPDQGVRAALLAAGTCEVELLTPTRADTGVARFHAARGDGLHHLCFESDDVGREAKRFAGTGVEMIDSRPRKGLAGEIAFVHPRSCAGILTELATPPSPPALPATPVALAAVHGQVASVREAAEACRNLFGLALGLHAEDWSVAHLTLAGVTLQLALLPAGGRPGLSLLRLRAPDLEAVAQRLEGGGRAYRRGPFGLVLDPAVTRGVPLIVSAADEGREPTP